MRMHAKKAAACNEAGLCAYLRCGKKLSPKSRRMCATHLAQHKVWRETLRAGKTRQGLCQNCSQPMEPGRAGRDKCLACYEKHYFTARVRIMKRYEQGLCLYSRCTEPRMLDDMMCFEHRAQRRRYDKKRRQQLVGKAV